MKLELIGAIGKNNKDPKRKNSPFYFQYRDRQKIQHRVWFRTEREAKNKQLEISVQLGKGIHTPKSGSIAVEAACADWLEQCKLDGLAPGTRAYYEDHVDRYIVPKLGMEKLTELTMPRVKEFVDDVTRATSRKNARRVLFSLRTVLKLAQENGKVAQNVAIHVKVKMKKQDLEPGKIGIDRGVPTPEEAARLLAGARPEFRPMLMTAVFTGMRWGELRALTWDDVDFKRHVIVVKQAADQLGNIKKPKTEAGTRELRMSPELEKRLREHKLSCPRTGGLAGFNTTEEKVLQIARIIEEHKAYGEHLGRPGAPRDENGRFARVGERDWHGRLLPSGNLTQRDLAKLVGVNQSAVIRVRKALREGLPLTPAGRLHFVFPRRDGGMRSHGSVTWELRELQREIGMVDVSGRPKFVPHRMRHWFASWCIAQGWPAKVLQAYLGHATIGETFDTYGHLFADPEGDQERLAKSDAAFPFLTVIEGGGAGTKNG